MDPRERADALLARARARSRHVVTPDNAISPMDASATLQIPRTVVAAADPHAIDPDSTMVLSGRTAQGLGYPPPGPTQTGPIPLSHLPNQGQLPGQQQHGQLPGQPQPGQHQGQPPQQLGPQTQPLPAQQPAPAPQQPPQQQAPQQQPPQQPQQQAAPPQPEPGLVPTYQQTSGQPSMAQRLDGGPKQQSGWSPQRLDGGQ